MNKEIKRKRDEPLHAWTERLAGMFDGKPAEELREAMLELSKESYISGVKEAQRIMKENFDTY